MNKLIELAEVTEMVRLNPTDFITCGGPETQVQFFYQKLSKGDFNSDSQAAQYFFNENSTSYKYKNLKRRVKQKMLNTLFFIAPKKNLGEFNEVYLFCCKYLFAAKILLNLGARNVGVDLCLKVFKKASSVELTEFILESSRYLRLHYGSRVGDKEKFQYFNHIFKSQYQILQAEHLAEEYYIDLVLPLVNKVSIDSEDATKAFSRYKALSPYLEKFKSPVLHFYGNYIKILSSLFVNDYQTLIEDCNQAIAFFEKKNYKYIIPLRVFYHNLLIGHTQLKQYQKGKEAVEKASLIVLSGTHSWYANKELHLILAFHSKEYHEVALILEEALNHRKYRHLKKNIKERWSVYCAYAHFLAMQGKICVKKHAIGKFKLGKFLNSIPIYSKDKRGLNIPILVIQILFMVIQKHYNKTIDQFDAIKKYVSRHVRKGENFRSHCFIYMLLELPSSNFHKTAVLRKTQGWYEKLRSTPLKIANQPYEIEIIPYEELWQVVVDSLENRFF